MPLHDIMEGARFTLATVTHRVTVSASDRSHMYHSEISEWWDSEGHHHEGHPSDDELLNEAVQVTGHVWDDEGNNLHWTSFSDDGWLPEEWEEDVGDAYAGYIGGEQ